MEPERRSEVSRQIVIYLTEIPLALMFTNKAVHGSCGKTLLHDDVMAKVIARPLALGAVAAVYDRQERYRRHVPNLLVAAADKHVAFLVLTSNAFHELSLTGDEILEHVHVHLVIRVSFVHNL